jgi:PKD repeat protein
MRLRFVAAVLLLAMIVGFATATPPETTFVQNQNGLWTLPQNLSASQVFTEDFENQASFSGVNCSQDTTHYTTGSASIRMAAITTVSAYCDKSVSWGIDWTKPVRLQVYSNATNQQYGHIRVSFTSWGGNFSRDLTAEFPSLYPGWNSIEILPSDWVNTGGESLTNMTTKIRFRATSGYVVNLSVDSLYTNVSSTPAMVPSFDDGYKEDLTVAAPILAQYKGSGTVFMIPANLDTGATFLTTAQLQSLSNTYGWTGGGHTQNHLYAITDNATQAGYQANVSAGITSLQAIGMGINATMFAYPGGQRNDTYVTAVQNAGANLARTSYNASVVFPKESLYYLNALQIYNTTTATSMNTIINNIWLNGRGETAIVTMHRIDPNDDTTSSLNWSKTSFIAMINHVYYLHMPIINMYQYYQTISGPVTIMNPYASVGNYPLTVTFNDTSTNTPTGWNWYIKNDTSTGGSGVETLIGTTRNISYTFSPGNWTVKLQASNGDGAVNSSVSWVNVTSVPPTASFTANITTGYQYPFPVQFTDTTTGTKPDNWSWQFGDTYTSTSQNPTHVFTVAGNYTVNETVYNATSGFGSAIGYINLTSDLPNVTSWLHLSNTTDLMGNVWTAIGGATFSTTNYKFAPGALSIQSNGAYLSTPSSSVFDWGSGSGEFELWINKTSNPNAWRNIVSRTSGNGAGTNIGWGLGMGNGDGTAQFWMGNRASNATGVFTITSNTWHHIVVAIPAYPGTINVYEDGAIVATMARPIGSYDSANPVVIGTAAGATDTFFYADEFRTSKGTPRFTMSTFSPPYVQYQGNLFVLYPDPNPSSTLRFKVNPSIPSAAVIRNETPRNRTVQGQNINETDMVMVTTGWDPNHLFANGVSPNTTMFAGVTIVNYTIDNTLGLATVYATSPTGFNTNGLTDNRGSIFDLQMLYWNYTAPDDPDYATDTQFFGSGTMWNATTNTIYPVHNFIATNITYGTWVIYPAISANATATTPGAPLQFTDSSLGEPTGFTNYNWAFGDGGTSTQKNPIYSYAALGNYTVTFTSSLKENASVTNSTTLNISVVASPPSAPVAAFTGVPLTLNAGSSVTFTDMSTGVPTSWNWVFGDGTGSVNQNPAHVYSSIGLYTVNLTATNSGGSNTTSKVGYINVTNATLAGTTSVDISMSPSYVLTLHVTDSSTGNAIPDVSLLDSYGNTYNTTTGTFTLSYGYGAVVLYLTSSGYTSKSASYIIDSSQTQTVQMVATPVVNTPSIVYIPQQVRIRLVDMNSYPLSGVTITAVPNQFTAPSNWTQILLGINPAVNITGSTVSGITGSDGSWVAPMLPSIQYNISLYRASDINYVFTMSPSQTEYTYTIPLGLVPIPTSAASIVSYSLANASINSTYQYVNMTYSDTSSSGTNYLSFTVYNLTGSIVSQTVYTGAAANSETYTQKIPVTQGQSYKYVIAANQSQYGWINQSQSFTLANQIALIGSALGWVEMWAAIAIILIFSALFSIFSKPMAMIGMPLLTWWFQFVWGWLPSTFLSTIGLGVMLALGILIYIRQKENMIQ